MDSRCQRQSPHGRTQGARHGPTDGFGAGEEKDNVARHGSAPTIEVRAGGTPLEARARGASLEARAAGAP